MQSKNQSIKQSIIDSALKRQFVHGICTFSDRWCERCTMTGKCLSFAYRRQNNPQPLDLEQNDIENRAFWKLIDSVFDSNLDGIADDSEFSNRVVTVMEMLETAGDYKDKIKKWLDNNSTLLEQNSDTEVAGDKNARAVTLSESIEIINRYKALIQNKIERSLQDLEERKDENDNVLDRLNPYRDNVGSAKVALIITERSVAAFLLIYPHLPGKQKEITGFIGDLLKIKAGVLQVFPDAMQFIRPGFDE